jgi:sucrose-6-phosphate hydrolase SacC (GH32 family)
MCRSINPGLVLALAVLLAGCGRYADFALPAPQADGIRAPFTWEARPEPVISRGDASDVLNPSVVRFQNAYWNLYSEFDGKTWHTAAATSADGFAWTKLGRVLSPQGWEGSYMAGNGSALVVNDEIFYWYEAGDPLRITLARSRDGKNWSRQGNPVVPLGPRGSFDESAVADPYVIRSGDRYYLFYLGQDRARRQRLGIARSADGITWEKLRSNPILELGAAGSFDEGGLGEPAVWTSGGQWWMLYTGSDRSEQRRMGLAHSSDGVRWERVPNFVISGTNPWDSQVICDPSVEQMPDRSLRVWFGGGDVPRPAQGLHGQIGVGTLRGQ